jgi:hypothetical protein
VRDLPLRHKVNRGFFNTEVHRESARSKIKRVH